MKKARGWPAVSSAEKRQSLKHATTYQAVNGIAMPRLFFTWVDFTTRDITLPFPLPSPPFLSRPPPCLSRPPCRRQPPCVPPTLAGCGLHPAAFTSLFPSTYASGTDILQAPPFLSLPLCRPHFKTLPVIIVFRASVPLITMIDSSRL